LYNGDDSDDDNNNNNNDNYRNINEDGESNNIGRYYILIFLKDKFDMANFRLVVTI